MKKITFKSIICLSFSLLVMSFAQAESASLASLNIKNKLSNSNSSYLDEINAEVKNTHVYSKQSRINVSNLSTSPKKVLTTQEMIQRLKKLSLNP